MLIMVSKTLNYKASFQKSFRILGMVLNSSAIVVTYGNTLIIFCIEVYISPALPSRTFTVPLH